MGFTLARLGFVPVIVAAFTVSAITTAAAISLFIATDLYDGILARRFDADTPVRRALDSIVDRLAIDAGLIAAALAGVLPAAILLAFLARDAYLTVLCWNMMRSRQVAIKADWLYRALNLSVATWALAVPFLSGTAVAVLALLLLGFSAVVAVDLTLLVRKVLSGPASLRGAVIGAGELRRVTIGKTARSLRASLAH